MDGAGFGMGGAPGVPMQQQISMAPYNGQGQQMQGQQAPMAVASAPGFDNPSSIPPMMPASMPGVGMQAMPNPVPMQNFAGGAGQGGGAGAFAGGDDMDNATSMAQMSQSLRSFWLDQQREMETLEVGSEQDFKNHNDLPLARIKRIMKSDEDVRMISAEAPVLFAKACEMFILELTLRSWFYSEKNKRRTLQKEDIQTAIRKTEIFDFLVDVIQ